MASKIVLAAGVTAAIVGAGGTALAATGSDTTGGTQVAKTAASSAAHGKGREGHGKGHGRRFGAGMQRLEHGQFVTKAKSGTVTHDLIRGSVSAVSASSISVKADDGTSMTFAVTTNTVVRQRTDGKGEKSTIATVKTGDKAFVAGTGTSTMTARVVVELPAKKK